MLTASQFMPMSVGAFAVLVPLAVLSAAYAVLACASWLGRQATRGDPGHVVGLALAVSLPLALLSAPLIEERSLGPVSYQVADAATYADFQDHLDDHTWRDEHFGLSEGDDRLVDDFLSSPVFQTGTIPLAAALSATFGWSALDSQSALMIAFVAIGCLGCFALVLTATKSSWAGVAAAFLYAGPVNYQLFIDGSQAALAALALLGPLAIVGSRIFHEPVRAGALFGLLVGGLMTVYPSFLPVVAVAFVLALAIRLTRARRADLARAALTASAAAVLGRGRACPRFRWRRTCPT